MSGSLHNDFDAQVSHYYNSIKALYEKKVAESDNKEYAREHYRDALLERNPKLPKDSFFFNALSKLLIHNYRLNKENALLDTFDDLYKIRRRAEMELAVVEEMYGEFTEEELTFLQVRSIDQEHYLLALEWHELTDLLACFLATRILLEEIPKNESIELYGLKEPLTERTDFNRKKPYSVVFTEHHQAYAAYYLLYHLGIIPGRDCNKSDFYRLVHLLAGHNITHVDNQNKKKIINKLISQKLTEKDIPDLKFIRPFFEKIGLDAIVQMIDNEIRGIEGDLH